MLKVVDIYGRELQTLNLGAENAGDHVYALKDMTSFSAGNYMVLLYEGNQLVARNKFMIVK